MMNPNDPYSNSFLPLSQNGGQPSHQQSSQVNFAASVLEKALNAVATIPRMSLTNTNLLIESMVSSGCVGLNQSLKR